jgi:hypothetical protein
MDFLKSQMDSSLEVAGIGNIAFTWLTILQSKKYHERELKAATRLHKKEILEAEKLHKVDHSLPFFLLPSFLPSFSYFSFLLFVPFVRSSAARFSSSSTTCARLPTR